VANFIPSPLYHTLPYLAKTCHSLPHGFTLAPEIFRFPSGRPLGTQQFRLLEHDLHGFLLEVG
jgi:hypothetical protein